ncbi:MAG: hypothetical protein P8Y78_12745 [Acidihalobacter sp.]
MKKIIVALMLSTTMLSGCGLFHSDKPWKDAKQENPLEIPPDMDRPNVSNALTIPSVNAQQASQTRQTQTAATAAPGVLHLDSDVVTAYKRVGLVLGNSDIGSITSQSDKNHTYQVAMASKMKLGSSQGFLERHFSNAQNADANGSGAAGGADAGTRAPSVTVQVSPAAGGGSDISATGDPQQVARLMSALKSRLGG